MVNEEIIKENTIKFIKNLRGYRKAPNKASAENYLQKMVKLIDKERVKFYGKNSSN